MWLAVGTFARVQDFFENCRHDVSLFIGSQVRWSAACIFQHFSSSEGAAILAICVMDVSSFGSIFETFNGVISIH